MSAEAQGLAAIPFIWFWPEGKTAACVMTHDVEDVEGRDFCGTLMDIDDSFGIKSSFQIVPEDRYSVHAGFLDSIRERGFEINVHDLNHDGLLFDDRRIFLERAQRINQYAREFRADGFRAGVMCRNQEWYDALQFSYEMSVPNVAHLDPQAGGCCTVMPYFIGNMVELPVTMIQDYTLFNILGIYSTELWKSQIETVMPYHGLISFIVHPDYVIGARPRKVYCELLEYLVELRNNRNVWMPLPREISSWWKLRAAMRLVNDGDSWRIEGAGAERASIAFATFRDGVCTYTIGESRMKIQKAKNSQFSPVQAVNQGRSR